MKRSPRISQAYILSGKDGEQYLFASEDDGIMNLHASSFARLASLKESDAQVLEKLARYLRPTYTIFGSHLNPALFKGVGRVVSQKTLTVK